MHVFHTYRNTERIKLKKKLIIKLQIILPRKIKALQCPMIIRYQTTAQSRDILETVYARVKCSKLDRGARNTAAHYL